MFFQFDGDGIAKPKVEPGLGSRKLDSPGCLGGKMNMHGPALRFLFRAGSFVLRSFDVLTTTRFTGTGSARAFLSH